MKMIGYIARQWKRGTGLFVSPDFEDVPTGVLPRHLVVDAAKALLKQIEAAEFTEPKVTQLSELIAMFNAQFALPGSAPQKAIPGNSVGFVRLQPEPGSDIMTKIRPPNLLIMVVYPPRVMAAPAGNELELRHVKILTAVKYPGDEDLFNPRSINLERFLRKPSRAKHIVSLLPDFDRDAVVRATRGGTVGRERATGRDTVGHARRSGVLANLSGG